jgi:hypothetical protein
MQVPGLPQHIFAAPWDAVTGTWHPPEGAILAFRRWLSGLLGGQPWTPPDAAALAAYIENNLLVEQDRLTLITEISYEDSDAEFAGEFLAAIHNESEALLRSDAELRTRAMIRHLSQQLGNVTIAEHRTALVGLLSESEKQLMLLDPALPYAATVIDPVSVGPSPNMPRPLLALVLVIFVTGVTVLAFCLWLVAREVKKRKEEQPAGAAAAGHYS